MWRDEQYLHDQKRDNSDSPNQASRNLYTYTKLSQIFLFFYQQVAVVSFSYPSVIVVIIIFMVPAGHNKFHAYIHTKCLYGD